MLLYKSLAICLSKGEIQTQLSLLQTHYSTAPTASVVSQWEPLRYGGQQP